MHLWTLSAILSVLAGLVTALAVIQTRAHGFDMAFWANAAMMWAFLGASLHYARQDVGACPECGTTDAGFLPDGSCAGCGRRHRVPTRVPA